MVLDADLAGATMTKHFKAAYPQRFFDCGIAEADMMNIAAGLSTMGLVPFCSTFAMFGAGRAYEQIRNSIAYPKFNVKICCSHAGVSVGEDGGSHQAIEDIGLMRLIPGMTVIVPADAKEARKATLALAEFRGPAYMRLARLATPVFEEDYPFEIGKANVLREGTDAAVFACGLMVSETLAAARLLEAQGIHIAVINVHTIKPIDAACVTQWAENAAMWSPWRSTASSAAWATPWPTCSWARSAASSARSASTISSASPARLPTSCGSMDSPPTRSPTASGRLCNLIRCKNREKSSDFSRFFCPDMIIGE